MPIDSSVLNCSDNIDVHGSLFSNVRKIRDPHRGYLLAHLNINGLVSKVDQIRLLLQYCSVDILALDETKVDESICSGIVRVRGYNFYRSDRSCYGGGVCLYISQHLRCSEISAFQSHLPSSGELEGYFCCSGVLSWKKICC